MVIKHGRKQPMPTHSCGLPLPPEEWDFREIPKSLLLLATEYEYARSSTLSKTICKWLDGDAEKLIGDDWVGLPLDPMRKAGLIEFGGQGKRQRKISLPVGPTLSTESPHATLGMLATVRVQTTKSLPARIRWPGRPSVREIIRAVFDQFERDCDREPILMLLATRMPKDLIDAGLQRIALLFDSFPEPFLSIWRRTTPSPYLISRKRISFASSFAIIEAARQGRPLPPEPASCGYCVVYPIQTLPKPRRKGAPAVLIKTSQRAKPGPAWVPGDPPIQQHLFLINWTKSPQELSAAFRAWVTKNHPDSRPSNARSQPAWLKRLGAYRLDGRGWSQVRLNSALNRYHTKQSDKGVNPVVPLPIFHHPSDWSEATRKTRDALGGDFIRAIREDFPASEWIAVT